MPATAHSTPRRLTPTEAARALDAVCAELCRKSLAAFLRRAWVLLNPTRPLVWSWHHEAMAEHMEAVAAGQIRKLVISVAPGHTKTSLVSVAFPAWVWTQRPEARVLSAAYEQSLANKSNRDRRMVIESDWYRQTFRPEWTLDPLNRVEEFQNARGGFMMSTSVGGRATGRHADFLLMDDLLRADGVYTAELANHVRWYFETFSTRVVDPGKSAQVLIMQRLHEIDIAGILIEQGWEHLFLPTEYCAAKSKVTSIGWRDPRTVDGELLFPAIFKPDYVAALKQRDPRVFAAQQNQDPIAPEGNLFKREWFTRFWTVMPEEIDAIVASWDFAFRKGVSTDFVVGQVWARTGADFYLLDQVRERLDFSESLVAVVALANKWQAIVPIATWLMEAKANGDAIIATLKKHIPGILPVDPHGTKEARAAAVTPFFRSGNVVLPSPKVCPWVNEYMHELMSFPAGAHDDAVDATSQAIDHLRSGVATYTLPDLDALFAPDVAETKRSARVFRASRGQ